MNRMCLTALCIFVACSCLYAQQQGENELIPIATPAAPTLSWCTSFDLKEDGTLAIKGTISREIKGTIENWNITATPWIGIFLGTFGIDGATTKDIKYTNFQSFGENHKMYVVIEKNGKSVLGVINFQFLDSLDVWAKGVRAPDNSRIFYGYENAIFLGPDGTVYGGTPTYEMIVEGGRDGRKLAFRTNDLIGGEAPKLIAPIRNKEGEWYWVQDEIMKNSNNEQARVYFKLANTTIINPDGSWKVEWQCEIKRATDPAPDMSIHD